jgi:hypothetical protein
MLVLAVLGVLGVEYTPVLEASGLDTTLWGGIVAAVLASAVRAVEGYRDGKRAEVGDVIKEDVKPVIPARPVVDPMIVFE